MSSYRRRPVHVKARQLAIDNFDEVLAWAQTYDKTAYSQDVDGQRFLVLNGPQFAEVGQWVLEWEHDQQQLTVLGSKAFHRMFEKNPQFRED
ncbi:UNVERIFIED_ORG: hypothetical protein M2328_005781 [Rhodococcus erythropolis]